MNIQGLYSVLEEDEEHCDESGSHELNRKLSNELSPISISWEDQVNTQLVFLHLWNYCSKINGKETNYHLQSESKIWEFSRKELISMYIEKEYSFVLTSKNEVLLIGNFASLLNIPDNAKPEFLKLPFLNQMKIIKISCAYSCALFLSEDGMVYSWGKDPNK